MSIALRTRFRFLAASALVLLFPGCGSKLEPESPTIEVEGTLSIGGGRLGVELTRVSTVAVGPGGLLAIAQPDDHEIQLFDAAGRFLRRIGREGEGPGEFQAPQMLGWRDDHLWVRDDALRRVSFFTPVGELVGEIRIPPIVLGGGQYLLRSAVPWVGNSFGGIAAIASPIQGESTTVHVIPILRIDFEPIIVLDTIGYLRSSGPFRFSLTDSDGTRSGRQPISDLTIWQFDRSLQRLLLLDRPVGFSTRDQGVQLTAVDPIGDTLWTRLLPYQSLPITRRERAAMVRRYADLLQIPSRDVREALWLPRFRPSITSMMVSEDGHIWIRVESQEALNQWDRLTPAGDIDGTLYLAPGERIVSAGESVLWTARDEGLSGFVVSSYHFTGLSTHHD